MTEIHREIQDIDEQIARLAKQKAELLDKTRSADLDTCRRLIKQYGFSKSELGLMGKAGSGKGRMANGKAAKYANPSNPEQTWNGHGRKPAWYNEALARGMQESALLVRG